jgi:putative ABC transport system permease protein
MFDFDALKEILTTIRQNKLRTFLTGFSIAWGIFILVILLGAGNGLVNGVTSNFRSRAANTISIMGGTTSKPFAGYPLNRDIVFDNRDIQLVEKQIEGYSYFTPVIHHNALMSYRHEYGSWQANGVYPSAQYINNLKILKGRFINQIDMEQKRKTLVLTEEMDNVLFKGEDPIGKYVTVDSAAFLVVGVCKEDEGPMGNAPGYCPFTTAQALYQNYYRFDEMSIVMPNLNTVEKSKEFETSLRLKVSLLHNFDPSDMSALWIWNTAEAAAQSRSFSAGLHIVIWIIGMLILIAGIIGIGNIMLITVKERTVEFGIRKAIGARPASILGVVILESVIITAVFGYIGMIAGIGITEIMDAVVSGQGQQSGSPTVFANPTVGLGTVLGATFTLIFSGVFAGLIPALKAVRVKPVEAMRAE